MVIKPKNANDDVGFLNKSSGYIEAGFGFKRQKKLIRVHHIAWFLHYGVWPSKAIDHKDGDRSNNKIENLRYATQQENLVNRGTYKNNSSGHTGVSVLKNGKFVAFIWNKNVHHHLGTFDNFQDAVKVRKQAELKFQKEFRRKDRA